jgi:hypothetical protein
MSSKMPAGYYDDKPFVYRGARRDQENLAAFKVAFVCASEGIFRDLEAQARRRESTQEGEQK